MKRFKRKHIIALLAVTFSVLLSSFGYYFHQLFFAANVLVDKPPQGLVIRRGTHLPALVQQLQQENILQDGLSFAFVARVLGYHQKIWPGYYKLQSHMSNLDAISLLRSGEQTPLQLRFHGLRLLEELPERVSKQLQLSADTLLGALCSDSVARFYGFDTYNFPLMFIPNTYEFYWTTQTEDFLRRMKQEYERFWSTERRQAAQNLGLKPIEVGILASIVQAETLKEAEKPRIAGVYLNRLRKDMPLGADPTLVFAWQDFSIKRVLNKHKTIDSPYNTYQKKGLPPGPINLPEIASIEAVLQAETHNYFYFCAKDDFSGYHVFSKNLGTHKYYARRYQRALSKQLAIRRNKDKRLNP